MEAVGNHAGFILAAYLVTALVLVCLFLWVVADGRLQKRRLAELEARGIKRRSAGAGKP